MLFGISDEKTKQIVIDSPLKTSKVSKPQPVLRLASYTKDKLLCVVDCLNLYIQKTTEYRKDDQLLISYVSPHKPVCSQSVSRWLKSILDSAGVDVNVYKAHSFRHASTSKAALIGIDMNVIFAKAGWSKGSSTFAKFYHRPIDNSYKFSDAVLKI